MKTSFTPEEIQQFVKDHIKSKKEHSLLLEKSPITELEMAGIYSDHDLQLYTNALFEGIINGIIMAGSSVEGIG